MASPNKASYIWVKSVSEYLAYELSHIPSSRPGFLYIYLLSFPRFWTFCIDRLEFLFLMALKIRPHFVQRFFTFFKALILGRLSSSHFIQSYLTFVLLLTINSGLYWLKISSLTEIPENNNNKKNHLLKVQLSWEHQRAAVSPVLFAHRRPKLSMRVCPYRWNLVRSVLCYFWRCNVSRSVLCSFVTLEISSLHFEFACDTTT